MSLGGKGLIKSTTNLCHSFKLSAAQTDWMKFNRGRTTIDKIMLLAGLPAELGNGVYNFVNISINRRRKEERERLSGKVYCT